MLQGAYRSFAKEEVCVRVSRLLLLMQKQMSRYSQNHLNSISDSNYHEILRRSIDFNPDRGRLYVQSQTLPTSRRAVQYVTLSPSLSRRCHTATANATAKVRSQESTQLRHARGKVAESRSGRKTQHAHAHSLGFCSRELAFARASKSLSCVHQQAQSPAAGGTTSGSR